MSALGRRWADDGPYSLLLCSGVLAVEMPSPLAATEGPPPITSVYVGLPWTLIISVAYRRVRQRDSNAVVGGCLF